MKKKKVRFSSDTKSPEEKSNNLKCRVCKYEFSINRKRQTYTRQYSICKTCSKIVCSVNCTMDGEECIACTATRFL